jgi:quinol monooxygenase YgiN
MNPANTRAAMTTISPSRKLVTLINVFTVEPANQRQLLELLARSTETSVRHARGFISASLHRSLDGTKVTMYAQWRSVADYQAMRENPTAMPYLQQALAIAKFYPGMYEVVELFAGTAPGH